MSSSINTACRSLSGSLYWTGLLAILFCLAPASSGQDGNLRVPSGAVAGQPFSISTSGSGSATFYLLGPSLALKRDVQLGQEISLTAKQIQSAGRYVATLCTDTCSSAAFFVQAGKPSNLTFLVHPSRAPVGQPDTISGVAFPFDEFGNLIFSPATVQFQLASKESNLGSHSVQTHNGVAWFRTSSGKSAGAVQVSASLNDVIARRVVQQVASDPCRLHIKAQRTAKGIEVETEPVRDCAGNPVPDGTVVTFTAKNGDQISTVDAPVKQDIARARISAKGPMVISAASGVVMGNELRVGAQ
ncbi:MAG TPA: hypothetical protein VFA67_17730 [Candidatus Sulfotelmatobacter sp.]|nr:hypothetical protein [Candidatus Sulfotelmatobacter sp.]